MHNAPEHVRVLVIGSGPSGWTASLYLSRAMLHPTVLAGDQIGGQLMLTTEIENFPGTLDGTQGPALMMRMREQAEKFGTRVIESIVTRVDFSARPFTVWASIAGEEKAFTADAVLISTGAQSILTGANGEQELIGRGVSTCAVCDAPFYRGKNVIVVGGGDSAMEDTLALTKYADEITIVHRRDSFRASKIMQERVLTHPKVRVRWNSAVKEVRGANGVIDSVLIENTQTATVEEMKTQGMFVAIGHRPASDIFKDQILLDEKGYIVTGFALGEASLALAQTRLKNGFVTFPTMTSIEGVFASGDVVDFRYRQASTAAGFGTMASLDIERWLDAQE